MIGADEREFLGRHSGHDAEWLHGRWRQLAEEVSAEVDVLGESGGYEVLGITTSGLGAGAPGIYLCAGVHGDEPAGPLGLLDWAEAHPDALRTGAYLILPCFNPWGIVHNTRHDDRGQDLNRRFDDQMHPHIRAWRRYVEGYRLSAGVTLHEDYDAYGCYLYEVAGDGVPRHGDALLAEVAPIIPPDPRTEIEGRPARLGLVDVSERPRDLAGQPEALALHALGVPWVMTFETPSEFSLYDRSRAQRRFLEAVVGRVCE
ncbi:hypothetical protein BH23VER1_BH23VER1_15080 [soil metagenome]